MTWHTVTVTRDRLATLLAAIRRSGGTVTSCRPQSGSVCVTWTTPVAGDT